MGAAIYPKAIKSPSTVEITLDLPVPPSVNRIRRVDWANHKKRQQFYLRADLFLTAHGPHPAPVRLITGGYEIRIQIPETLCGIDLDNHCKCLIDGKIGSFIAPRRLRKRAVMTHVTAEPCQRNEDFARIGDNCAVRRVAPPRGRAHQRIEIAVDKRQCFRTGEMVAGIIRQHDAQSVPHQSQMLNAMTLMAVM